ncbi:MAG: class I SAM-dependent methyltransferase [Chloroflexi bacterium]|nr:class I SAM-dependent methyltransferase [Chloroflexota bacterium]
MTETKIGKLLKELTLFFGIDEEKVLEKLEKELFHLDSYVAECWNNANPISASEIEEFYKKTDAYIYNLSVWNATYARRKWTDVIIDKLEEKKCIKVLDFGAGIGDDCIKLYNRGFRVDYCDLKGLTSDFALWRFSRQGCADDIKMCHDLNELPVHYYDAIICIDVLEHIADPLIILEHFSKSLKPKGCLLLTESFSCVNDDYPSHLRQNIKYAGKIHRIAAKYGLLCLSKTLEEKPLYFVKADKNIDFFLKLNTFIFNNYIELFKKGFGVLSRNLICY